jgi:hypothetical protein
LEDNSSPVKNIGHSPLYKQNAEELEADCKYIVENLDKGFIEPGYTPFASSILIARVAAAVWCIGMHEKSACRTTSKKQRTTEKQQYDSRR